MGAFPCRITHPMSEGSIMDMSRYKHLVSTSLLKAESALIIMQQPQEPGKQYVRTWSSVMKGKLCKQTSLLLLSYRKLPLIVSTNLFIYPSFKNHVVVSVSVCEIILHTYSLVRSMVLKSLRQLRQIAALAQSYPIASPEH